MLSSFASESPSAWCHLTSRSKGMEARSGEAPSQAVIEVGWLVSMDGNNGVGTNYSSFVPS
jgi:hypothetical protein